MGDASSSAASNRLPSLLEGKGAEPKELSGKAPSGKAPPLSLSTSWPNETDRTPGPGSGTTAVADCGGGGGGGGGPSPAKADSNILAQRAEPRRPPLCGVL